MNERIRLLLVDDHELFLEGIVSLLDGVENIEIIGKAYDGVEALELIRKDPPDMLLADLNMPRMNGVELVKAVKHEFHDIKVIVLTMHNDRPTISEIMMAEAEGYVLKNTGKKELLTAISRVADGTTYYCNEVMSIILDKYKHERTAAQQAHPVQLTDREKEILQLIAEEKSTEEIAEKLFISKRTVETHRKNILKKAEVKSVVGLLKFGYRVGLIAF